MSAQELTFRVGELAVTIGGSGFPTRVGHTVRTELDFLQADPEPGPMIIDGSVQDWEFAGLITDVDETEARYSVGGRPELEYTIRNTFAGNWLQRHMLLNTSSSVITVDDLVLRLQPADGFVGWAWTASAETTWTVQPSDGAGPRLSGDLTQGAVAGRDSDGFHTGAVQLPPGRRFVLQWRINTTAQNRSVLSGSRALSAITELPPYEPYEVDDPDVAVLVEDPLSLQADGESQLVFSDRPGRYPIELRSARGTSRIELTWVPTTEELITDPASLRLPGAGAALGLQLAFSTRLADLGERTEEALVRHTGLLLDQPELSIMDQAFLAHESVRTGDHDARQRALSALLAVDRPRPGLGLAATRVCIAELAAGGDPSPVLRRLYEVATGAPSIPPGSGGDHLSAAAVRLEMTTVTGPAAGEPVDLQPSALAVGAELGAGLPGHRIGRISPATAIYAAAVLDLLPESTGPELEQRWGITPQELAQRTRNTALAEALWPRNGDRSEGELSDIIGWLVLGLPIG